MYSADPFALVSAFNARITARDLDGLASLMSEDHRFVDTAGAVISGKPACIDAWRGFFSAFPDYRNIFERTQATGNVVAICGHSVCSDARLAGPVLWRADLRPPLVHEWRVLLDNPANRATLG